MQIITSLLLISLQCLEVADSRRVCGVKDLTAGEARQEEARQARLVDMIKAEQGSSRSSTIVIDVRTRCFHYTL